MIALLKQKSRHYFAQLELELEEQGVPELQIMKRVKREREAVETFIEWMEDSRANYDGQGVISAY